ncbi:MAG: polysaccharide export protein, partial [Bacteriovoracaceae bacterium]|nr:polysaccharide export protein [Bacteriovoracaceae bacterium]
INSQASETRIELRRGHEKSPKVINLIKLNREGGLEGNPFLQENDVVFVPRKLASAVLQGTVKYPGVYEISPSKTTSLWDVIELGGNFTVGLANGVPLTVIRYDETNQKKVFKVNNSKDELQSFKLQDGDSITSPHKFTIHNDFDNSVDSLPNDHMAFPSYTSEVFVLGGVKVPGKFPFVPQHRLSKYVAMAGGLSRLGRDDLIIYRSDGNQIKTDINTQLSINPGDTLVVGEDKLGPEFWITLMTTLAGVGLSAVAIFRH